MTIGIIGAMSEEIAGLVSQLKNKTETKLAGLTFYQGKLNLKPVVIVQSGIGKVNAAMCTQILINCFKTKAIINTGVAGGIDPAVKIGDVVISTEALHHDMDATAFGYQLGQIPQMQISHFPADQSLQQLAFTKAQQILQPNQVHLGLVASGDQFISSLQQKEHIGKHFQASCVEMEGAAIAHVAYLNQIPYVIIRIISDQADNSAPENFGEFTQRIIPILNEIVLQVVSNYSDCSER
ncbi:MAG: 5'-methylthioadenosine/adenosylhomocysteine nucleosidase [Firmicutes bacterium]|nr:5'-methylthioadenosine/adenosylhomocysteine nucleosidase [Bacillota bacterium]